MFFILKKKKKKKKQNLRDSHALDDARLPQFGSLLAGIGVRVVQNMFE